MWPYAIKLNVRKWTNLTIIQYMFVCFLCLHKFTVTNRPMPYLYRVSTGWSQGFKQKSKSVYSRGCICQTLALHGPLRHMYSVWEIDWGLLSSLSAVRFAHCFTVAFPQNFHETLPTLGYRGRVWGRKCCTKLFCIVNWCWCVLI